jgi:hypothetical protein
MKRREFIAGLGSAVAWPVVARSQRSSTPTRFSTAGALNLSRWRLATQFPLYLKIAKWRKLVGYWHTEQAFPMFIARPVFTPPAFSKAKNPRIWTIPIVFVAVSDPIGSGFVTALPRPGGNITGFMSNEPTLGGKWLQLLTEIAPAAKRAAFMFNPDTAPYARSYYLPSFEAAARMLQVTPIVAPVQRRRNRNSHQLAWTRAERRSRWHGGQFYVRPSHTNYIAGSPKQRTGSVL